MKMHKTRVTHFLQVMDIARCWRIIGSLEIAFEYVMYPYGSSKELGNNDKKFSPLTVYQVCIF